MENELKPRPAIVNLESSNMGSTHDSMPLPPSPQVSSDTSDLDSASTNLNVPRWWLYIQALFWRPLMRIGMFIHTASLPSRPPKYSFVRYTSLGNQDGTPKIPLYFYCPNSYFERLKKAESMNYPVVVNFHGGGFTLGAPTDDSYWAKGILEQVDAVFVSVGYRLAPEHPFPAAVDDGVQALLYLEEHARELGLDISRVSLTGFSAGANLSVTVPLRLRDRMGNVNGSDWNLDITPVASTSHLLTNGRSMQIVSIFLWYPILDFVASRDHRRAISRMPDKTLPSYFTDLFDESYLPDRAIRRSPFASPARAPDNTLVHGLPEHIFLYTCEWDMLLQEGQEFIQRLQALGKRVRAMMIEKAPHAWDKSPNPFRDKAQICFIYKTALAEMKAIFDRD
jgi:putative ergosteryl-3beta-O-L-aspartate hydrolase